MNAFVSRNNIYKSSISQLSFILLIKLKKIEIVSLVGLKSAGGKVETHQV